MSNPPPKCQVQSVVEMQKHSNNCQNDYRDELDESMQSQQHWLNRSPTIGASDGCRKNRRPSIGAVFGAKLDQVKTALRHRFNRWVKDRHRCIQHTIVQR